MEIKKVIGKPPDKEKLIIKTRSVSDASLNQLLKEFLLKQSRHI